MLRSASAQLIHEFRASVRLRWIIIGVIAADLLLIAAHVAYLSALGLDTLPAGWRIPALRIDVDGGFAELFTYLQELACCAALMFCFAQRRETLYLAWSVVFLVIFCDDALLLHEHVGRYLSSALQVPELPGLRRQDSGELLAWGLLGVAVVPLLLAGFRQASAEALSFGIWLAAVFALLVGFAAGVDMVHVVLGEVSRTLDYLFALVEDGGEMLTISVAMAGALLQGRRLARRSASTSA